MLGFVIPKTSVFLLALAVLFQVNGATPQGAKTETTPAQHPMGTRQSVQGIPNFGQVSDTLYRGALPNTTGLKALKKMGIDVVVDLRRGNDGFEEKTVTDLGMKYVSIPSRCPFPQDDPIARFLGTIEENRGKKVFVHCRLDDDRTGIAVAAYRMAEQGWNADEALKEMHAFGFSSLHTMMCPGLERYEQSFPERLKNDAAFRQLPSRTQSAK